MFVTLLKEKSDVIFNMWEGITPLAFFLIFRWLISSHTSDYSNAWKANLFVSFAFSLILMMLGCILYRKIAAWTGCSIGPSIVIKGALSILSVSIILYYIILYYIILYYIILYYIILYYIILYYIILYYIILYYIILYYIILYYIILYYIIFSLQNRFWSTH